MRVGIYTLFYISILDYELLRKMIVLIYEYVIIYFMNTIIKPINTITQGICEYLFNEKFPVFNNRTLMFDDSNEENIKRRIRIEYNTRSYPEIEEVEFKKTREITDITDIRCCAYALSQILETDPIPPLLQRREFETNIMFGSSNEILERCFTMTTEPQNGDLVVYYNKPKGSYSYVITHYGIYRDNNVESKWGGGEVFIHPPYYVPEEYGDRIKCFRLNSHLTPEKLLETLSKPNKPHSSRPSLCFLVVYAIALITVILIGLFKRSMLPGQ